MAQVLVVGAGDDSALVNRSLARALAALPDGWTLLIDRCIGGASGGYIEAVLVHAEIGVAVIDEAPGDASLARATLCRLLQRERFSDYFPGDLPVVAVGATAEPPGAIGEQLAAAFDAAPRLSIGDPDWAYAVIELILESRRLDVTAEEEAIETVRAEPVFCGEGTVRVSSRTAGSAVAGVERGRTVGDALSLHKVQFVPLVAVWLLGARGAARARPRSRWIMAVKWAGLAGALVGVTWSFGYRLERTPRLDVSSPAEVETMAVSLPAVMERVTFPRRARSQLPDSPALLRRSVIGVDPVATTTRPASPSDAAARPVAKQANSGRPQLAMVSRARRASPSGAASQDKVLRPAKGSAAAVTRSASITPRHVECADWLHQNRPGGSDYHGPPVAECSRH